MVSEPSCWTCSPSSSGPGSSRTKKKRWLSHWGTCCLRPSHLLPLQGKPDLGTTNFTGPRRRTPPPTPIRNGDCTFFSLGPNAESSVAYPLWPRPLGPGVTKLGQIYQFPNQATNSILKCVRACKHPYLIDSFQTAWGLLPKADQLSVY